jgi:hypothetical protein
VDTFHDAPPLIDPASQPHITSTNVICPRARRSVDWTSAREVRRRCDCRLRSEPTVIRGPPLRRTASHEQPAVKKGQKLCTDLRADNTVLAEEHPVLAPVSDPDPLIYAALAAKARRHFAQLTTYVQSKERTITDTVRWDYDTRTG